MGSFDSQGGFLGQGAISGGPVVGEFAQASLGGCAVAGGAPFPECAAGKYQWVSEQLHTNHILIGKPKEICAQPGTWLIDDRAGYGPRWEARGGRLLSLQRPWNPSGMPIDAILGELRKYASAGQS